MNPNATMKQILAELASDEPNRAQVAHLLVSLSKWIATDGLLPTMKNVASFDDPYYKVVEPLKPHALTIVLDCSGSLAASDASGRLRWAAVQKVLSTIELGDHTHITVQAYGETPGGLTVLCRPTISVSTVGDTVARAMLNGFGGGPGMPHDMASRIEDGHRLCIITDADGVLEWKHQESSRNIELVQVGS